MKFVYIDESGDNGQSDFFVMVALEIDYTKLNKYTRLIGSKFEEVFDRREGNRKDFKTKSFHRGAGGWRAIPGNERQKFLREMTALICECSKAYVFPLSFSAFDEAEREDDFPAFTKNYWAASGLFVLSHIQRIHCEDKRNKGNCVIIIDDNKKEHSNLAEQIYSPDAWLDELSFKATALKQKRRPKNWNECRFDQIINTPFAVQSEHATIVQGADMVAFIVRRYLELKVNDEAFLGEKDLFDELMEVLKSIIVPDKNLLKGTAAYNYFKSIQPTNWDNRLK